MMIEFDKQTGGKEGLIAEVKRLCEFYKIDNLLEEIVHRDTVKRAIIFRVLLKFSFNHFILPFYMFRIQQ